MVVESFTRPGSSATGFPGASVEATLRGALLDSIKSTAPLQGIALPSTTAAQYAVSIQLDSLEVVSLLCEVESIVGFELKDSLVKTGGYRSIDEAVGHLMPRIEAVWRKRGSTGGTK